jgi:hypothetical protein
MKRWSITSYAGAMRCLRAGRKCFPEGTWYVTNEYSGWSVVCSNWRCF